MASSRTDGPLRSIRRFQMKKLLTSFVRDTDGQDLIEYALLAATIGLGALVGMRAVRDALNSEFSSIGTSITGAS
jgi:pilus assembly protein Flp/PilA